MDERARNGGGGREGWREPQEEYTEESEQPFDRLEDKIIDSCTQIVWTDIIPASASYSAAISAAKVQYASENNRNDVVPYTANFNGDNVHLNYNGEMQLGFDIAQKVFFAEGESTAAMPQGKVTWTK